MATPGVKFDTPLEEIVELIKKHRGRLTKVAKELNCKYDTVRKYTDPYPEVVQLIKELRRDYEEDMCDLAEDTLFDAMDKRLVDMSNALKSAFFLLNNKGKDRGYNHPDSQNSGIQLTPAQITQVIDGHSASQTSSSSPQ